MTEVTEMFKKSGNHQPRIEGYTKDVKIMYLFYVFNCENNEGNVNFTLRTMPERVQGEIGYEMSDEPPTPPRSVREKKKKASEESSLDVARGMKESAEVLASATSGHASSKSAVKNEVDLRSKEADLMSKYVAILQALQGNEQCSDIKGELEKRILALLAKSESM